MDSAHTRRSRDFVRCYVCSTVTRFTNTDSLDKHLLASHPKQKTYQCGKCSNISKSIAKFNQHLARHESDLPYKCSICTLGFVKRMSRIHHEAIVHKVPNGYQVPEKQYGCPACGKKFSNECRVKAHVCEVIRELLYDCPKCMERFPSKRSLIRHQRSVHADSARSKNTPEPLNPETTISSCNVKTEASDVITTEEVHIVSTLPAAIENVPPRSTAASRKLTSFKCYMCAEKPIFAVKASLDEHLSTVHPQIEAYTCEECNSTLYATERINYHLSRHDASERPYKCSVCSLRFVQESLKKRHEISVHMISNGYEEPTDKKCCLICGKKFSTEYHLQDHMRTLHQKNAPKNAFWCYLCSTISQFDNNDSLADHLAATHPELKSYSCTECNIMFHERTVYNWHLSTHDATVRPYKCSICPRRFMSQSSKHKHEYHHGSDRENGPEYQSSGNKSLENCQKGLTDTVSSSEKTEAQTCDMIKTEEVHIYDECPPEKFASNDSDEQADTLIQDSALKETETPIVNTESICCYLCSPATQFQDSVSFYIHLSKHRTQETNSRENCDKSFDNVLGYNKRLPRHDADTRPFKCSVCALRFIEQKNQIEHEASIHNIYPKKHETTDSVVRAENMTAPVNLQTGENTSTSSRKRKPTTRTAAKDNTKCFLCSNIQQFEDKTSLNIHILSVHVDQDKYECNECNTTIQHPITFNMHLSRHGNSNRTKVHIPISQTNQWVDPVKVKEGFKCYLCNNSPPFEDRTSLNIHILSMHMEQDTYECSECHTTIRSVLSFNLHLARHDASTRPSKCSICSLRFTSREGLLRHESLMHKLKAREPLKRPRCPTCGKEFIFESELKKHTRSGKCGEQKPNENNLRCYICSAVPQFDSLVSLNDHLSKEHSKQGTHSCVECDKIFYTVAVFNQHLSRHDDNARRYKCIVCPMRFLSRKTRTKHENLVHNMNAERHTQPPSDNFCCPTCGQEFTLKCELKEHMRVVHGEIHSDTQHLLTCYICEKSTKFEDQVSFNAHLSTFHPTEDEYECKECSVNITNKYLFSQHLSRHDAELRPYKCTKCSLRFVSHSNRTFHESIVHSNQSEIQSVPKYDCTFCGEKFMYQSSLSVHIREAHGNREIKRTPNSSLFKCYLCSTSVSFEDRASLNSHLLAIHANQEAYTCEECNITMTTTTTINKHRSQHDPIARPHKCTICPLRFIEKEDRKCHEANVHGMSNGYQSAQPSDSISCETCGMLFPYKCRLKRHKCKGKQVKKRVFKCYLCNGAIIPGKRKFLMQHLATAHPAQDKYTCQHCHFSSTKLFSFNEHLSQHVIQSTMNITTHEQDTVQSAFAIESSKTVAKNFFMRTIKLKKHSLKCYLCNTHIGSKQSLKEHLETAHLSQSLYQCVKCAFSTNRQINYNSHQMLHDRSVRRYKCRFCPLRYLTAQYRKCHEQFEHDNGFKQIIYACPQCNEKFSSKWQLKLHKKTASHIVLEIAKEVKSEPQETETPHSSEPINESAVKTEEMHIYSELSPEGLTPSATEKPSSSTASSKDVRNLLECYICSPTLQFKEKASLDAHLKGVHPGGKFECSECNKQYSRALRLNHHLSRHDATLRAFKCTVCPKRFTQNRSRIRHQESSHNIKEIDKFHNCPVCTKKFVLERNLRDHMRSVHDTLSYACATCGETYPSEPELKLHKNNVHSDQTHDESDYSLKSNLPNVDAASNDSVVPVDINVHNKEVAKIKPNCCYLCSKTTQFEDTASLHEHLWSIHAEQETRCDECSTTFVTIGQLNEHRKRHDINTRPFKCSTCSLRFFSRKNQRYHENNVHSTKKDHYKTEEKTNHACPDCNKSFRYKSLLNRHKCKSQQRSCNDTKPADTIHVTPKKLFQCYFCTDSTVVGSRSSLMRHLSAKHFSCNPHTCQHCGFSSMTLFSFNEHLSQHVVETTNLEMIDEQEIVQVAPAIGMKTVVAKNFGCATCGKRFEFECSKIRHEQYMHPKIEHTIKLKKHSFKCYLCNTQNECREALMKHLDTVHVSRSLYECRKCPYSTTVKQNYNNHQMLHNRSERRYKCRFCSLRYMTAQYRRCHEQFEHVNSYACTECDGKFCFKWQVRLHEKTSSHTVHKIVMQIKSETMENERHYLEQQQNNDWVCQPTIKTEEVHIYSELSTEEIAFSHEAFHETQQSGDNYEALLKCYLCPTRTVLGSKTALAKHLKLMHPSQSIYQCTECEYTTKSKLDYNYHCMKHAAISRSYKCSFCPESFHTSYDMVLHKASAHSLHPSVKIYSCSVCKEKFLTEKMLQQHEQSMRHATPKPYSMLRDAGIQSTSAKRPQPKRRMCSICRKRILHDRYDQHMHAEHGIRKLACPTCAIEFDSGDKLKQHELVAHGMEEASISEFSNSTNPHMQILTKTESSTTANIPDHDVLTKEATIQLYDAVKLEEEFVFPELPSINNDTLLIQTSGETSNLVHETFLQSADIFTIGQNVVYPTSAVKSEPSFYHIPSTSGSFNANGCSSTLVLEELSHAIKTEPQSQHYGEQLEADFTIDHPTASDAAKSYLCHLCNPSNQLESRNALEQHLAFHPAQNMYYCGKCGFSVNLITIFNQHLSQHYAEAHIKLDNSEDANHQGENMH